MQKMIQKAASSIKKNLKYATTEFIFILVFISVFQTVFGPENSIVAVIFTIMMSASMVRDMTARPVKHLIIQALVLVMMGVSAYLVGHLNPWLALPIDFVTIFIILYAFTYEYANHMYFPYILSYLFLIFISPVGPAQLPKRLVGLLAGAVCIILYQLFKGRNRVVDTARNVLTSIIGEASGTLAFLLNGEGEFADPEAVRANVCKLSRTVYERRKKVLCVSDASFSMIDAGRGLEHLILLLHDHRAELSERPSLLKAVSRRLDAFQAFLDRQAPLAPPEPLTEDGFLSAELAHALEYIYQCLAHMTDLDKREHYRETALSLSVRIKAAMDVSPVRVTYALRTSILLSVFIMAVQLLALPHGKWLLFTLASLSLPYADDIGVKTRKRIVATILGGLISVAAYCMIPPGAGRTAVMMLSGYLSFFFSDYTGTYACSTVGALGGAVMSVSTLGDVGSVFLVRMGYICIGAAIAYLVNCVLFPFHRSRATHQLVQKYSATTELLTQICHAGEVDPQLYYNLVIQAHLLEEKLAQNAAAGGWESSVSALLADCRHKVRQAHRQSGGAPILSW